jgi:hypothetical protein
MPRPRRGSKPKPVFGGPRAAKSSLRCANTPHPTTGDPHVSRMSAWSLASGNFVRSSLRLVAQLGLLAILPAEGSQYLLQRKGIY